MKKITIEELGALAIDYSKKGLPWHHHLLTPKCTLNDKAAYQIILENEETGDSFVCYFDEKPMKELENLENVFFKR